MLLRRLADTSDQVADTASRLGKVDLLSGCLSGLDPAEAAIGTGYLAGEVRQGKIGVGYATISAVDAAPATEASLSVLDVDSALQAIAAEGGPGSTARRRELLEDLLSRATEPEQRFLRRLMVGELRQGALEGVMVEAIAAASGQPAALVRRAVMLSGDLGAVAAAAQAAEGGLDAFRLELFTPVKPMLAQTAETVEAALAAIDDPVLEVKVDGARIQVHRVDDRVAVYTRGLNDMTPRIPELVELVRDLPVRAVILDGEAVSLAGDGRPRPFQETMGRFGTEDDGRRAAGPSLAPFFFDCLHVDGTDLIDLPAVERFAALAAVVPDQLRITASVPADEEDAAAFMRAALDAGHEGVMVKSLSAPYEAGRRGAAWLKVKPAHTLDLVVLAVEWGSGRRRGLLSNIHLGARDPATGGWVMLGKTFKGMTDEMLRWQTDRFLELATRREGHVVYVRPEQVVEIAFDGVLASPRYPGGMALRFARVKAYRPDKPAEEVDTVDTVRHIFERGHRGG